MLELQNGKIDVIVTGKAVAQINVKKYDHIAICKTTVGDDVAETAAAAVKKSSKNVDNTSFLKSINALNQLFRRPRRTMLLFPDLYDCQLLFLYCIFQFSLLYSGIFLLLSLQQP